MAEGEITVTDQASGKDVRTLTRTINASDYHMQSVVQYRGGIQNWLTLYAQHTGDDWITLPYQSDGNLSSKFILTRRPMPSDLEGVINNVSASATGTSNTSCIYNQRFFLDESILEDLHLTSSTVRIRGTFGVKVSNGSGTGYLNSVKFDLAKLNASETHTSLGSKTINVSISNATTTEVEKSIVAIFDLSNQSIGSDQKLEMIVNTLGAVNNTSDTVIHTLYFDAGTSKTYVEIQTEEA